MVSFRPHVIFSAAITLDGKLATRTGDSKLSSKADKIRVHKLRSKIDAILIGKNTVKIDDPLLSVHNIKTVSYTHLRAHETREDRGWRGVG